MDGTMRNENEAARNPLERDRALMRRAIELATRGKGFVSPNPMVGAVIADADGHVVAEGYHRVYGGDHAEVDALRQVDGADLRDATLYVTLEPCAHYGSTPPCVESVVASGVGRVVVAMRDPNPLVDGRGNKHLREAGIEVVVGVLEHEARSLNEAWIHFMRTGRPFVTVKMAQSLDGYIALPDGESQWITGEMARQAVHEMRAASDAVLVGTQTALHDDPSLTVRLGVSGRNPRRIILDRNMQLPLNLKVFTDEQKELTTLVVAEELIGTPRAHERAASGIVLLPVPVEGHPDNLRLDRLIEELGRMKVTSLLVEGGAAVIDALIADRLVDKLILFIGPKLFGHGIKSFTRLAVDKLSDAKILSINHVEMIGEDIMVEGYFA